jgi:hypothetical protein
LVVLLVQQARGGVNSVGRAAEEVECRAEGLTKGECRLVTTGAYD